MTLTRLLNRRGGRTALGLLLSLRHWREHGIWVRARWLPREASWLFSYPDAEVRSRNPVPSYYAYKESIGRDAYLYSYVPGPGDTVVQVGAGSGWEAPMFSRLVGPFGRVYLIEAHPRTFAWLRARIDGERLANVTAINVAVGDRVGTLDLTDQDDHQMNHVVEGGGVRVAALRLGDLFAAHGIDRVDLLTINVEGFEREVVRGLLPSAGRVRHAAVSCHDFVADRGTRACPRTREEVRALLAGAGFEVRQRDPADPRDWIRDYLYARRPEADHVRQAC